MSSLEGKSCQRKIFYGKPWVSSEMISIQKTLVRENLHERISESFSGEVSNRTKHSWEDELIHVVNFEKSLFSELSVRINVPRNVKS